MFENNVAFGTFLTFLFMVGASAWFWMHLRYALFGQRATGQWLVDRPVVQLLRIIAIPFGVAVLAELWYPVGGMVGGFHPVGVFIAALIGVIIDWVLYGIGEALHHELPAALAEPTPMRRAA